MCLLPETISFFAALPLYSMPCRGEFWFAPSCLDLARRPGSSSDAALPCIPQSFFSGCVLLILVARPDARYPFLITRRALAAEFFFAEIIRSEDFVVNRICFCCRRLASFPMCVLLTSRLVWQYPEVAFNRSTCALGSTARPHGVKNCLAVSISSNYLFVMWCSVHSASS